MKEMRRPIIYRPGLWVHYVEEQGGFRDFHDLELFGLAVDGEILAPCFRQGLEFPASLAEMRRQLVAEDCEIILGRIIEALTVMIHPAMGDVMVAFTGPLAANRPKEYYPA